MDAYCRGVAAILKHIGRGPEACAGHKEYALPGGRKPDPSFDMNAFRASVRAIITGIAPPPTLIPKAEPDAASGAPVGRKTLRRGDTGDLVKEVQRKINVPDDGTFGPKTEAAVRRFQRERHLVPDGIVGPKSWMLLDEVK